MTTYESGIFRGVPFPEYLRWPLTSQSIIKQGRDSMRHLHHAMSQVGRDDMTDDMRLGSALHTAFLEPGELHDRVINWTGAARRGKEWEQFEKDNSDKIILTNGYWMTLMGMLGSMRSNSELKKWQQKADSVEVSCIGEVHGLRMKGRVDALTNDPLWDLKKISSADDRTINNTIYEFGYHIQGYIYCTLFKRERFCLGFVEGSAPYDVRPVELSPAWLKIGKIETTELIQRFKWCVEHDDWPGRSPGGIELLEPPTWVTDKFSSAGEVTFEGEQVFKDL